MSERASHVKCVSGELRNMGFHPFARTRCQQSIENTIARSRSNFWNESAPEADVWTESEPDPICGPRVPMTDLILLLRV